MVDNLQASADEIKLRKSSNDISNNIFSRSSLASKKRKLAKKPHKDLKRKKIDKVKVPRPSKIVVFRRIDTYIDENYEVSRFGTPIKLSVLKELFRSSSWNGLTGIRGVEINEMMDKDPNIDSKYVIFEVYKKQSKYMIFPRDDCDHINILLEKKEEKKKKLKKSKNEAIIESESESESESEDNERKSSKTKPKIAVKGKSKKKRKQKLAKTSQPKSSNKKRKLDKKRKQRKNNKANRKTKVNQKQSPKKGRKSSKAVIESSDDSDEMDVSSDDEEEEENAGEDSSLSSNEK
jgi:hypothetical protein